MKTKQPDNSLIVVLIAISAMLVPVLGEQYAWDNVPIGGGGFITGIVIHPKEKDLQYIRTDVGGAYRWDPVVERWRAIFDWVTFPDKNLFGIDGIAIDPENTDVVYALCGAYADRNPRGLYKSSDRGKTWSRLIDIVANGNGSFRWAGEPIFVVPGKSSTILVCGRGTGLLRTVNSGTSWDKVSGLPESATVRSIVGTSAVIYAADLATGVYRSIDQGATFSKIDGPLNANRLALSSGGILYATGHDAGVYKYEKSAWTTIQPEEKTGYGALAVDPNNPDVVIAARIYWGTWCRIWLSTDRGATWKNIIEPANTTRKADVPWWPGSYFSASTAAMIIDPHRPNRLLFTDWYGVWRCENIYTPPPLTWTTRQLGHEEIVVTKITSSPSGPILYTLCADNVGFRSMDIAAYPTHRFTTKSEATGIDFCEKSPQNVAMVESETWGGKNTRILVSTDYAATWNPVTNPGGTNGKIVISADDPTNMVYLPGTGAPYYTTNTGSSWTKGGNGPSGSIRDSWIFNWDDPIDADRVKAGTFYLYCDGKFYRSDNKGVSWSNTGASVPSKGNYKEYTIVKSAPNHAGVVWLSRENYGLWKSSDFGDSFQKDSYFEHARCFGWGKGAPGSATPAVYVHGKHNGVWGIHRSVDFGKSWTMISDEANAAGYQPGSIVGDRQVFGRVYIGSHGRGVMYGEPTTATTVPARSTRSHHTRQLTSSRFETFTFDGRRISASLGSAKGIHYIVDPVGKAIRIVSKLSR